jgi:ribosomal protein S14
VIVEIPDDATLEQAKDIVRRAVVAHAHARHGGHSEAAARALGISRWGFRRLAGPLVPRRVTRHDEILRRLELGGTLHRFGKGFKWHGSELRESENAVRTLQRRGQVRLVNGVVLLHRQVTEKATG